MGTLQAAQTSNFHAHAAHSQITLHFYHARFVVRHYYRKARPIPPQTSPPLELSRLGLHWSRSAWEEAVLT